MQLMDTDLAAPIPLESHRCSQCEGQFATALRFGNMDDAPLRAIMFNLKFVLAASLHFTHHFGFSSICGTVLTSAGTGSAAFAPWTPR